MPNKVTTRPSFHVRDCMQTQLYNTFWPLSWKKQNQISFHISSKMLPHNVKDLSLRTWMYDPSWNIKMFEGTWNYNVFWSSVDWLIEKRCIVGRMWIDWLIDWGALLRWKMNWTVLLIQISFLNTQSFQRFIRTSMKSDIYNTQIKQKNQNWYAGIISRMHLPRKCRLPHRLHKQSQQKLFKRINSCEQQSQMFARVISKQ